MADEFTSEDYVELHSRLMAARDDDVTAILSNNFNVVIGALRVAAGHAPALGDPDAAVRAHQMNSWQWQRELKR